MAAGTIRVGSERRALRALVALVALAAIGVGIPLVLLRWGHWPIYSVPSLDEIRDGWSRAFTDRAFFGVLTVAAWLVWAMFILSTLTELWAEVAHRRAARIQLAGPLQRWARYLVLSLLMSISASHLGGGRGASPPPLPSAFEVAEAPGAQPIGPAQDAASLTAAAHDDSTIRSGEAEVEARAGNRPVGGGSSTDPAPNRLPHRVTVQPNDTAWGIAESLWGDGLRWTELWETNRDRLQPDGRRWSDPELIHPGWEFVVPGTSPDAEVPATEEQVPAPPLSPAPMPDPTEDAVGEGGDQDLGVEAADLRTINVENIRPSGDIPAPEDQSATPYTAAGEAYLVGDGVVRYLDPATFSEVAAIHLPGRVAATIDADGILWTFTPRDGVLRQIQEGEVRAETQVLRPGHDVSMTTSGNRPILLDRTTGELWLVDRRSSDVAGDPATVPPHATLQPSSAEGTRVWMLADQQLLGVRSQGDRVEIALPDRPERLEVSDRGVVVRLRNETVLTFDEATGELLSVEPADA